MWCFSKSSNPSFGTRWVSLSPPGPSPVHTKYRHTCGIAVVFDVQTVMRVCAHLLFFGEEGSDWYYHFGVARWVVLLDELVRKIIKMFHLLLVET